MNGTKGIQNMHDSVFLSHTHKHTPSHDENELDNSRAKTSLFIKKLFIV
jgi:hypothetical protein